MSSVRLLGELDPCFAWDGRRLYRSDELTPESEPPSRLRGAAGTVCAAQSDPEHWRFLRDPLGIDKIFWAPGRRGGVDVAARPWRLIEEGHSLDQLRAIPRGRVIDWHAGGGEIAEWPLALAPSDACSVVDAGRAIRGEMDNYLEAIASAYPSAQPYVCLSGGLDSSGIAALVRDRFPAAIAVSFDLETDGGPSDDRLAGERVAADLGMPMFEVDAGVDELLSHLDVVLREGIDWRDFNVHAGLVNAVLASAIAKAGSGQPLVFTGDLSNEFLVDYEVEHHRGVAYYELPRLAPKLLRASLVRGLDSCHREIGVFGAWTLPVVQPYAVACDTYLSLSGEFLGLPDRKERLAREAFGDLVPEFVFSRPKARAQVGSRSGGGVLAACVDRGIDSAWLRRRFCSLHSASDPNVLDGFVRAGRYRSALPSAGVRSHEQG